MPIPWGAIGACVLPNVGGWMGAFVTTPAVKTWYKDLNKAPWNPPDWLFAPAWTTLYTAMGYASYLVYRDGGGFNGEAALPLSLYGGHLVLNWMWTPLFFYCRSFKWSFFEILALDLGAIATACSFSKVNMTAAYLFIPYIAWLTLATTLNGWIYFKNDEKEFKNK